MAIDTVDDLPGAVTEPVRAHVDSIEIDAPPSRVWALVTALERYGEWSNENTGGYWRKGPDGEPGTGQVGDQFVGVNRRDGVEWKAPVEIIRRVEDEEFAFVTGGLAYNFVLWRYQLEPTGNGTRLTESWTLRQRTPLMVEKGDSELESRRDAAVSSIRATLEGMKAAAEAG
jgi:hypothetical protein